MTDKKQSHSSGRELAILQTTPGNKRHPSYKDMIKTAITHQRKTGGSSTQDILNHICSNYNIKDTNKTAQYLKQALLSGVKTGFLKAVKGKRATEYFKLATEDSREIRRPVHVNKSNPLPPSSSKARQTHKSQYINSKKPCKDKSMKGTVIRDLPSSKVKTKAKASLHSPFTPSVEAQKDKNRRCRGNAMPLIIKSKAASQSTSKYGHGERSRIGTSTGNLPASKRLTPKAQLNSSELQSTSSKDATEQPILLPDIRASLLKTYKTRLATPSHHEIAAAPNGKKLILERSTWSVKYYSPDMKLLSRIQLEPPVRDIAICSDYQALVTTDDVIYCVDFSSDKMSVTYTLNSTECLYGITKCKEHIYVTCQNDDMSVQLLDVGGKILWSVSKDRQANETSFNPASIASFVDNGQVRLVVVDDFNINILDGKSGEFSSTRKTKFGLASSVATAMFNNIYLCYPSAGVVSVLRSDLSNERVLITSKRSSYKSTCPADIPHDLLDDPRSIAYDQLSNQLVICSIDGKVQIYQLNPYDV